MHLHDTYRASTEELPSVQEVVDARAISPSGRGS